MSTEAIKILGQVNPSASSQTNLYTPSGSAAATISTLTVCNTGSANATFRINVGLTAGSAEKKGWLYYDVAIPAYDTFMATIGLTLENGKYISVYASTADLAFQAFGVEITA